MDDLSRKVFGTYLMKVSRLEAKLGRMLTATEHWAVYFEAAHEVAP